MLVNDIDPGTQLQSFQFYEKYSKWNSQEGRRETFEEAVERSIQWAIKQTDGVLGDEIYNALRNGMLEKKAFPSMRLFQVAGVEAERHPESIFNCSYLKVDRIKAFTQTMWLLGLGVGVGYSVEKMNVSKLPEVKPFIFDNHGGLKSLITFEDSLEGWVKGFEIALRNFFDGIPTQFDYSKIRPSGSPLITRGGVASGPEPLQEAMREIEKIFFNAQGRKLTTLECHDIQCFTASAIVSGGFRRSAMIALFDENDELMLHCKDSENIKNNKQRYFANNSLVVEGFKPLTWWEDLMVPVLKQKTGEPGIFSRFAAKFSIPERRIYKDDFGTNPCGEIILRPSQFCNLSIANVTSEDTILDLIQKVYLATIWGTIMSSVDNFTDQIEPEWSKNQKEERLLGVDLNGQRDNALFNNPKSRNIVLERLSEFAVAVNKMFANELGIKQAAAVTCAKPAGNSSVFFGTASGCHGRYSPYYIRRASCKINSPVYNFLKFHDVPYVFADGVDWHSSTTVLFEFPIKSPDSSVFVSDLSAKEQLEYWADVKTCYTEHNPSVTISYNENEIESIVKWLYDCQAIATGLSFFPKEDATYKNAPYEKITEEQYKKLKNEFPIFSWESLKYFDNISQVGLSKEFACVGGVCEIV